MHFMREESKPPLFVDAGRVVFGQSLRFRRISADFGRVGSEVERDGLSSAGDHRRTPTRHQHLRSGEHREFFLSATEWEWSTEEGR